MIHLSRRKQAKYPWLHDNKLQSALNSGKHIELKERLYSVTISPEERYCR